MNIGGGEAADQLVRMMLSGSEVAVRLSGSAIKNVLALTMALAKKHKTISGKVNLAKMLKETRDVRRFAMSPEQYQQFRQRAGKQKILFSAIRDSDNKGKVVDVIMPVTEIDRANIITVDGMDVEVPEDVYLAYAQADRRERYITEEQSSGKLLSLEQMEEDALLPDYVGAETAPSAETEALEREELRNLAEQKQILLLALLSLKDTDRELINALFFDGASTREYAQRMGVSQRAVIKRRDRILRDLKKFFENSSK